MIKSISKKQPFSITSGKEDYEESKDAKIRRLSSKQCEFVPSKGKNIGKRCTNYGINNFCHCHFEKNKRRKEAAIQKRIKMMNTRVKRTDKFLAAQDPPVSDPVKYNSWQLSKRLWDASDKVSDYQLQPSVKTINVMDASLAALEEAIKKERNAIKAFKENQNLND
jgi:hypothetical protein